MPDMEQILKQVQDTLTVTVGIQDRHARMIVDHAQWLEDNSHAMTRHREWLEQHEAAMHELDEKLDRLTDLIIKGRGGNGDSV